jgi:TolB protein
MRRALAVISVVVAPLVLASGAATTGHEGLIAFSSDRSPLFTDHLVEYLPDAPAGTRVHTLAAGAAPAWSPDGRRIAFVRGGAAAAQVYVMNADGGGLRQVTNEPRGGSTIFPAGQEVTWSPDGTRISYVEYGPTTKVLVLSTGVTTSFPTNRLVWSPDRRRVAYVDFSTVQATIVVSKPDGTGATQIVNSGQNYEAGVSWSPDGNELLYTAPDSSLTRNLFLVRPDGTGRRQLSHDRNDDLFASWSPNGKSIAFFRASSNNPGKGWLALIGADRTHERTLALVRVDDPAFVGPPTWSRDGKRVALGVLHGGILITSAAGGNLRLFDWRFPPRAFSGAPSWRPIGDELLFSVHITTNPKRIYVASPDGTGVRRLTRGGASDDDPAWSPDGSLLAFVRAGAGLDGIWVMSANGAGERRLTTDRTDATPAWSPDGRRVAFVRRQQLWMMQANGSGQHRVLDHDAFPGLISWSPDGRWIAFSDGRIEVVAPNGTGLHEVTQSGQPDGITPAWSPGGTRIAFSGFRSLYTISADGSGLITVFIGASSHPSWSPDGRRIVFQTTGAIDVINSDGSSVRQIADRTSLNQHPAWGPATTG